MTTAMIALMLIGQTTLSPCAGDPNAPDLVISQKFDLLSSEAPDAEAVGMYRIYALHREGSYDIRETMELTHRGQAIKMRSTVICRTDADGNPIATHGGASTTMNGESVMSATFKIAGGVLTLTAKLHDPEADGDAAPRQIVRTIELPEGPVLLSSTRAVVGPMLLKGAGELPVVWVEFPDDVDGPINVKPGFSLVRSETAADGSYTIRLRKGEREIGETPLDADGRMKPHRLFDKYPMREKPVGA